MSRQDPKSSPPKRVDIHYFSKPKKGEDLSRADTVTLPEIESNEKTMVSTPPFAHPRRSDGQSGASTPEARPEQRVRPKKEMTADQAAQMSLFGHQLFQKGLVEESRVVFEGLVSLEVKEAFPYTMLGTIYLSLDDSDRALALFEAALRIDRDDLAALVYKGEIQLSRRQFRAAQETLERAQVLGLKTDPFVQRAGRLLKMTKDKSRTHSR